MALAVDASSPARTTGSNAATSVTSASFTPPAGSVLVTCIDADDNGTAGTIAVTVSSTPALTWTERSKRISADAGGLNGVAQIATAEVTTSQAYTVTATVSGGPATGPVSLKVYAVTGADTASPVGAVGEGSTIANAITPTVYTSTVAGSRAFGCATDWSANGVPVSADTEDGFHVSSRISGLSVFKAADTATSGSAVTLNFDGAGTGGATWNWVAVEIKPAAGGPTTVSGTASLTSAGSVTASASVTVAGTASLTGAGTVTASAGQTVSGAASLTGVGSLTATASVIVPATASLTGAGTLSAQSGSTSNGSASPTGAGSLTAGATLIVPATATLAASSTATATATLIQLAAATLTGAGSLSAASGSAVNGSSAIASTGSLTATAVTGSSATAPLTAAGSLTAAGTVLVPAAAALAGVGSLTALGGGQVSATAVLTGAGVLTATVSGRITYRPNTGTTSRPTTGTITRPNTGTISRP